MTHYQTIKVSHQHKKATITLNRPEVHNALSALMIQELTHSIKAMEEEREIRFLVIQGAGKNFCAGADIDWMKTTASYDEQENRREAETLATLFRTISQAPFPVIVYAKGAVYGGGVGLVAAGDIGIADSSTVFCLSEVKLGIIPAVIAPYLMAAMGQRQAKRYALTAEPFKAMQAHHMGLVHYVIEGEECLKRIEAFLLLGSPHAQCQVKRLFHSIKDHPFSKEAYEETIEAIATARASPHAKEGFQAFFDKRLPQWEKIVDKPVLP